MQLASPNGAAYRFLGYQQITSLAAAASLTIPAGTCLIEMVATTQAVRFRADGTDPTAAIGFPLVVGVPYTIAITTPGAIKVIEQAASAALNINYFGL